MKKFITLIFTILCVTLNAQLTSFYSTQQFNDSTWSVEWQYNNPVTLDQMLYYPMFFKDRKGIIMNVDTFRVKRLNSTYGDGAPSSIAWATSTGDMRRTDITGTAQDGYAIVYDAGTTKLKYAAINNMALPSMAGNSGKVLSNNGTTAIWIPIPGSDRYTAYSAGTAYTLNTTSQKVDFSTTDPVITITSPGTYMIYANVKIEYAGLTTALNALNFKLRRTNNTATDITNATTTFNVPAVTLLTGTGGDCDIPMIIYTTTNSNDVIEMWGNRSGGLTLGSIQVGEASLVAVRIQ